MYRILLVEDDAALVAGLKYSLEKDGFEVKTAGGVRDGEALFAQGGADLVILDVGLPDGTGFDLCRIIRKQSRVPVIFLTACDEEINVVMGLDMGGDDYIAKPFRLRELLSRIHALIRRTAAVNPQGLIKSNGLTLDIQQCRLYRDDTEIPLTPAEFRLLRHLMANPRRTVTRGALLDGLWDSGGDFVDANTLTVYIRRLREKIERDASSPELIITVRGVGYKWDAPADGAENGGKNAYDGKNGL